MDEQKVKQVILQLLHDWGIVNTAMVVDALGVSVTDLYQLPFIFATMAAEGELKILRITAPSGNVVDCYVHNRVSIEYDPKNQPRSDSQSQGG